MESERVTGRGIEVIAVENSVELVLEAGLLLDDLAAGILSERV